MKKINYPIESLSKDTVVDNSWAYIVSRLLCGDQFVLNAMTKEGVGLFLVKADGIILNQITNNNDSEITPLWICKCEI